MYRDRAKGVYSVGLLDLRQGEPGSGSLGKVDFILSPCLVPFHYEKTANEVVALSDLFG